VTLYLIRHADAGKRNPYSSSDHLRELSEAGWRQARRIADRLESAGVTRVLSSPSLRCHQTVEPLAERLGLRVESHTALAEGAYARAALDLLRQLAGTEAVLCSHGDVIPETIRLARITGTTVNGEGGNAKGSIWTITTAGSDLLTAAYAKTPRKPGPDPS
jgi:8-oxo-dGTP diphosphatase